MTSYHPPRRCKIRLGSCLPPVSQYHKHSGILLQHLFRFRRQNIRSIGEDFVVRLRARLVRIRHSTRKRNETISWLKFVLTLTLKHWFVFGSRRNAFPFTRKLHKCRTENDIQYRFWQNPYSNAHGQNAKAIKNRQKHNPYENRFW